MRSVVVVLPASMWAMMPMFLQRSNGTVLGTTLVCSFWGSDLVVDLVIWKFSNLVIENSKPAALHNYTITKFPNYSILLTSGNARMPCLLPPCDAHLLSS